MIKLLELSDLKTSMTNMIKFLVERVGQCNNKWETFVEKWKL